MFWDKMRQLPRAWAYYIVIDKSIGMPIRAHFEKDDSGIRMHANGAWKWFESWEVLLDKYTIPRVVHIDGKKFKGNSAYEWFDEQGRPEGERNWGGWQEYYAFRTKMGF